MKKFILLIVLIIILTIFATSNAAPVSIQFATTSTTLPLSLALILPIGVSLLIFTLFYLAKTRGMRLTIHDLEDQIEESGVELTKLTKRIHKLELENKKLRTRLGDKDFDDESI